MFGGSSPVAARVEVHEMKMDGNVMQMRQLKDGLEVPAGGTAELAPGGTHLMFIGITQPLKQGDMVPVTLEFAKAGKVEVQFMVGPANATSMEHQLMNYRIVRICGSGRSLPLFRSSWYSPTPIPGLAIRLEPSNLAHRSRCSDQDGAPITEAAFKGHPTALFFGFTHCPEVCPTTLFEMARLAERRLATRART